MNMMGMERGPHAPAPVRDERGRTPPPCGPAHGGGGPAMKFILIGPGPHGHPDGEDRPDSGGDTVAGCPGPGAIWTGWGSWASARTQSVDFSHPACSRAGGGLCDRRPAPPWLSGTTGLHPGAADSCSLRRCRWRPVAVERQLLPGRGGVLPQPLPGHPPRCWPDFDVEITETHHNKKADAPSGTAKLLLQAMDPEHTLTPVYGREGLMRPRRSGEVGIHALRGGTVAGDPHGSLLRHRRGAGDRPPGCQPPASSPAGALPCGPAAAGQCPPGSMTCRTILFGE